MDNELLLYHNNHNRSAAESHPQIWGERAHYLHLHWALLIHHLKASFSSRLQIWLDVSRIQICNAHQKPWSSEGPEFTEAKNLYRQATWENFIFITCVLTSNHIGAQNISRVRWYLVNILWNGHPILKVCGERFVLVHRWGRRRDGTVWVGLTSILLRAALWTNHREEKQQDLVTREELVYHWEKKKGKTGWWK